MTGEVKPPRGFALERPVEASRDADHLRHNNCQTAELHGRATPPHRQNQLDVALFAFRHVSETGDYTDASLMCQAKGGIYRTWLFSEGVEGPTTPGLHPGYTQVIGSLKHSPNQIPDSETHAANYRENHQTDEN
jgi:hypothetical protein